LPVVFVHSIAGSVSEWSAQLAYLRRERRAVALELRGHGRSEPPPDEDYAVESLARDIAGVVNGLGLKRFLLVGHDLGAAAAIAYASGHHEQVAGLLLVNAPGKVPPAKADELLASLEADFDNTAQAAWNRWMEGAPPTLKELLTSSLTRVPREAALSMIRGLLAFDPLPALRAYAGPTLAVVTPHHDGPNDLHHRVPGLAFQAISDTSHWPHLDQPEEFNRILDEFLSGIPSPTSLALGAAS
jgi:pimeloyl-ACP methyl ester carboxylesterase